jgi:hypothetical protein
MESIRWGDVNQIEGPRQRTTRSGDFVSCPLGRTDSDLFDQEGDAMNRSISLFSLCVVIAVASVFALVAWSGGYEAATEIAHVH